MACCKDCKDRTVEPNCHMTCERYLKTKEQYIANNEMIKKNRSLNGILGNLHERRKFARSTNGVIGNRR